MTQPSPAHLRLHVEELPDEPPGLQKPEIAPLLAAFEQATGWRLRCERAAGDIGEVWSTPIAGNGDEPAGRLSLFRPESETGDTAAAPAIDLQAVRPFALGLAHLLGEMNRLRHALWQREAELAAGVPVAARPDDEPHLAERLEAVLKGGAEAVGCQAAGLYLLDETTSELKLRACWGLDSERLMAPARPLRGSVADLEALVGHAVVLEDTSLLPHWRCPESFPSAVCVPVASPSIPLGTLWVFSDRQRDFSAQETNLIEIVAGRLAADLEREMLLAAGANARTNDKQLDAAARWQADRLPTVAPLLDDFEVAGWTRQAGELGGDFHDWSVLPDGRLALAVGDAEGQPCEGALGAAALHAAIKAHAAYPHSAAELLARVNDSLITASPGNQRASLGYALLDPGSGRLELALSGGVSAILVGAENRRIISGDYQVLGESPDASFHRLKSTLAPGEVLLLLSSGAAAAHDPGGLVIGTSALASLIARHPRDSACGLKTRLCRLLDHSSRPGDDLTVLIVKRRG